MKELLGQYAAARRGILSYFEIDPDSYPETCPLIDQSAYFWTITFPEQLNFWEQKPDDIEDDEYSLEIVKVYEKAEYTLIKVYSDSNNSVYLGIFDNSKRLTPSK